LAGECSPAHMLYGQNPSQGLPVYPQVGADCGHNIERVESVSWRQSWCSGDEVKEKLSDCSLFRLKPPGFIVPRQLLPRDLDSLLEKVPKLVLKPVLYWIVGVDSSFSPACLAADVPSVVPPSDMVRMVPPRQSCQAVKF
jgi:hypothetical protein